MAFGQKIPSARAVPASPGKSGAAAHPGSHRSQVVVVVVVVLTS